MFVYVESYSFLLSSMVHDKNKTFSTYGAVLEVML